LIDAKNRGARVLVLVGHWYLVLMFYIFCLFQFRAHYTQITPCISSIGKAAVLEIIHPKIAHIFFRPSCSNPATPKPKANTMHASIMANAGISCSLEFGRKAPELTTVIEVSIIEPMRKAMPKKTNAAPDAMPRRHEAIPNPECGRLGEAGGVMVRYSLDGVNDVSL